MPSIDPASRNRAVVAGFSWPTSVVQADHESVMGNLIVAGVGLSLLREDLARARAAIGEVVVLEAARLTTTLQFIYLAERADDPEIAALLMALRTVWKSEDAAPAKKRVRGKRRTRDMIAKDG